MDCSFCGSKILTGTGKIFVQKDGTSFYFCSNKCEKNQLKLKRNQAKIKWTEKYHIIKQGAKA